MESGWTYRIIPIRKNFMRLAMSYTATSRTPSLCSRIGKTYRPPLSDNLFEVIEAVSELDENEQEAFYVWLNDGNRDMDTEDLNGLIDSFRDDYQGNYKDEEDYAYEIIEQCYDLPEFALSYFDYEKFARDLFMTDYWFEDGHVFRRA